MKEPPSPTMAKSASGPTLLSHIQRNRLTPRSAEACRRTGVEPSELMPLPVSAFRETGMPPEVEKLKWAEYEALRMEAYETVQSERERVIEERSRGVGVLAGDGDAGTLSSGSLAAATPPGHGPGSSRYSPPGPRPSACSIAEPSLGPTTR